MKRIRSWFIVFLTMYAFTFTSCKGAAFTGGIRITTVEAFVETPDAAVAIGQVEDSGEWLSASGSTSGTQTTFIGLTNFAGIDDHPNAEDNSTWQTAVDYTAATDGVCSATSATDFVPTGGRIIGYECLLPAF